MHVISRPLPSDAPLDKTYVQFVIQEQVRIYGPSIGDDTNISLTIRCSHLFNDVVSQFRRVDVLKSFAVHFSVEPGSDIGGIKREMFCLLKESMCRQQHIFAETDSSTVLVNNVQAVINGDFEALGKVIASCCLLGGPPLHCFSPPVAEFLAYNEVKSCPDISCIAESNTRLCFTDEERLPHVSLCGLTLTLPRNINTQGKFKVLSDELKFFFSSTHLMQQDMSYS